MKLERLLQILMASLAVLATIMLGMGQQRMMLALAITIAAVCSLVLTDTLGIFRLHRMVANLAMVIAAAFSLNDFFRADSQQQLLAIAHLLIYVQIILLFQQKTDRIYGQLAVFSLLEVVVAALLNEGLGFGLLLIVYMLIGFFALAMFYVHRELQQLQGGQLAPTVEPPKPVPSSSDPLASVRILLTAPAQAWQPDPSQRLGDQLFSWRFTGQVLAISMATLVFTFVYFYTTPRSQGESWKHGGLRSAQMVGFAPEVSFDEMGKILQSDEMVMRVTFSNYVDATPYTLITEPYFRGAVLTNYVLLHGRPRWKQSQAAISGTGARPDEPKAARELVRQDIILEPTREGLLFGIYPVYAAHDTPAAIRIQWESRQLFRSRSAEIDPERAFRYSLVTTGFRFGRQIAVIPHINTAGTRRERLLLANEKHRLTMILEEDQLRNLRALAERIVQEKAPDGDKMAKAKALEAFFLEPGRFTYSLDFTNVQRNNRLDPVEDFVTNHRTGHCEYFASALTLMLRSQGIPARMVVGYRGGEFNYLGNYYVVRQRHAHSWVEAYLEPDEVPPDTLDEVERHNGGGWLRLDPTPGQSAQGRGGPGMLDRISKSFDYAQWLWNDYVLRLTPEQQRLAVLQPLGLEGGWNLAEVLDTSRLALVVERIFGPEASRVFSSEGMRWKAGLLAAVLCLCLWALYRLLRWGLGRWSRRRRPGEAAAAREIPRIDFYERLEELLARFQLQRAEAETQREFAGHAQQQLASQFPDDTVAYAPGRIVEAFYQVRFGLHPLDPAARAKVDQALDRLAQTRQTRTS